MKHNYDIERAGAMSFANLTEHQMNCYNYTKGDIKMVFSPEHQALINYYLDVITQEDSTKDIKTKYHRIAIKVALEELHYPNTSTTKPYTWSGNKRASMSLRCGMKVAKSTWIDNQLCKITEYVIDDVTKQAKIASACIKNNLIENTV